MIQLVCIPAAPARQRYFPKLVRAVQIACVESTVIAAGVLKVRSIEAECRVSTEMILVGFQISLSFIFKTEAVQNKPRLQVHEQSKQTSVAQRLLISTAINYRGIFRKRPLH